MSTKEKVERLRDGLRLGDANICGESPKWIQEELLKRVSTLLDKSSAPSFSSDAESFVVGAVRFVADRCGSECDQLVESISEVA